MAASRSSSSPLRDVLWPTPGRAGDPGLFGPNSLVWRVHGETALMVGGGRSLLMQLAHPAVAAGVWEHSGFPDDAFTRLWRTLNTSLAVTFGDSEQSELALDRINGVHRRVHGRGYDATDPALLLWVHATTVDTTLLVHDRFVGGLSGSDRDRYYRETKGLAVRLGVPQEVVPGNLGEFQRYVRKQLGRLEVSDEARRLAADVLAPPVPPALRPAALAFRQITIGLLPPSLRDAYGLRWDGVRDAGLTAAALTTRTLLPLVPPVLRRWPHARAAGRRAGVSS